MGEPRIYVDCALVCDDKFILPESASHHISRVLRRQVGHHIWLFNGQGGKYLAEIVSINKYQVEVTLLEFLDEQTESKLQITLAQSISKAQHMDYALQKAVELGVNRIVPIINEYGNVQIKQQREEKKLLHWQKIIVSACEQCGRNFIPELSSPIQLIQWLEVDHNKVKLLLHPGADRSLSSIENRDASLSILSGAEGGFSPTEVEQAISRDYVPVALGPRVLRTETSAAAGT